MLLYFYFCFNDRLIHNVLSNKIKYPSLDSINKDTVLFPFIKTDFGRALIKLNIRVINILQNDYYNYSKEEKYKNTLNEGMKILSCFIEINDTYSLNLIQSIKLSEFYNNIISQNIDLIYLKIVKEKNKLETFYKNFFIFELDIENLVQEIQNSLDIVLGVINGINNQNKKAISSSKDKIIFCILKSNYYFTLSRFYQILHFIESRNEKLPSYLKKNGIIKDNEETIYNLIDKIFLFYKNFIYNSRDNSLLLMSNYIFKNLCKAPIKYGLNNFDLFFDSVKNIINNSKVLSNINNYLKNLFSYLEYLRDKLCPTINQCLLKYLSIIELLIVNIKSLNPEETINDLKGIMIKINEEYKISKLFFDNECKDNEKENDDIYEKALLIYMKLINDIFDFTNEEDKKRIIHIIKTDNIFDLLKKYNINLALRTEFIKYIRKIFIDLSYNEQSNQIYTNSIISINDNLLSLKNNPLISNLRYPTKLLSFLKDFLNLSIRSEISDDKKHLKNYTFKIETKNKTERTDSHVIQLSINNKNNEKEDIKKEDDNNNSEEKRSLGSCLYSEKSQFNSSNLSSIKNEFKPCFDNNIYDLLMNELINVKTITNEIKLYIDEEMELLRNYFENGLLIPIIYFLKKSFAFSHCLSGIEMIKLYKLIIESCNLRLYIAEFKYDFWKEMMSNNSVLEENNTNEFNYLKEEEHFCRLYNNKRFMINGKFCINNNLNICTINAINLLKRKLFLCFDFTSLYDIFEQNIYSLLNDRKVNTYKEFFINEKNIKKQKIFPRFKSMNESEERIIKLYLLYKNSKNIISNENNSSLFSILPEICLEYETNYRHLLIKFLINNCLEMNLFEDKYLFLLYKLISLQTSETQNILINLIRGNNENKNDLGFIINFGELLSQKLIQLFIEIFNPPDKLLDINYVVALLLIKIFKYFCEEHNNFFQYSLMKNFNYKYVSIIPIFYNEESKNESSEGFKKNRIYDIKDINFFLFYLHVALKIILVSEWNKLDYNDENNNRQNEYLYDIFESILEMLNEIIQGNKPECLNILANSIVDNTNVELENKEEKIIEIKKKNDLFFSSVYYCCRM